MSVQVLLQYQSKSYYIIGQEVYCSIGRFITLSGSYYIIGRFLLHYRAVITVSGVYYIIGWYSLLEREPTRSKDRGLLSCNIDAFMCSVTAAQNK